METPKTTEFAHIGKSVIIKGELSGSEDLYVDGQVEGSIELSGNRLIIGPHGQVRAKVNAKGVIVQGKLDGNILAGERVELTKSAIVVGDIATQRVAIEEGAYFKGKVDIQREGVKADGARPVAASAAAGSSSAGSSVMAAKTAINDGKVVSQRRSDTKLHENFPQFIRQRRAGHCISPGIESADAPLQQSGPAGQNTRLGRSTLHSRSGLDLSGQHPLLH